jgi:hypothetical protein
MTLCTFESSSMIDEQLDTMVKLLDELEAGIKD